MFNIDNLDEQGIMDKLHELYKKQLDLENELQYIQIEINFCLADLKELNKWLILKKNLWIWKSDFFLVEYIHREMV